MYLDINTNFGFELKKLAALAFVPPYEVIWIYMKIINSPFFIEHETTIQGFVNYFEDAWIGRPQINGKFYIKIKRVATM